MSTAMSREESRRIGRPVIVVGLRRGSYERGRAWFNRAFGDAAPAFSATHAPHLGFALHEDTFVHVTRIRDEVDAIGVRALVCDLVAEANAQNARRAARAATDEAARAGEARAQTDHLDALLGAADSSPLARVRQWIRRRLRGD